MSRLLPQLRFSPLCRTLALLWAKWKIDCVDVVSFDLFDTLVCRPFHEPQDVFLYLAQIYGESDFYKYRINAEKVARETLKKIQVNFDEIYQCMPQKFFYLKEKEAAFEYDIIYANPEIKELYNYAVHKGKKIIITTDMYYSYEYLARLLTKNGYTIYDHIYISGYLQKAKYQGTLFPYVVQDLKIKPSRILHIGDNHKYDYKAARAAKLKALRILSPRKKLCMLYPRLVDFAKNYPRNLTLSLILGLITRRITLHAGFNNYWEEFGYIYGGGACYGLSKFILGEMKKANLQELICIARDGYTIKRIISILDPSIRMHYIVATRAINLQVSLETEDELPWTNKARSIVRMYAQISDEFRSRCKDKEWSNDEECVSFVRSNYDILLPISREIYKSYLKYISQFQVRDSRVALFDIAGGAFNSYKLIRRVFQEKSILGLYWQIAKKTNLRKGDDFKCVPYRNTNSKSYLKLYELLEFLITAPELPIKGVSGNGEITRLDNKYERKRVDVYRRICMAEVQFTNDYLAIFGQTVNFDVNVLIELCNMFTGTLGCRDKWHFRSIFHPMDEANTNYVRLLSNLKGKK